MIDNQQSGVTVTTHDYDYDTNGNRTQVTESNINNDQIITYDYDDADRLTQVIYPDRTTSYTLDKVGNRERELIDTGGILNTRTYGYNTQDQLLSITDNEGLNIGYSYDNTGNQISKTENNITTTFDYTARQRVKTIAIGGAPPLEYQYDYAGQRISKQSGGSERRYVYDGISLIAETNVLGTDIARYHYGSDIFPKTKL